MGRHRIISTIQQNKKKEEYLPENEEIQYRLSHGLYDFLYLDIMPTETYLLIGNKGMAFMKFWKLRKKRREFLSIGMLKIEE